MSSGEVRKVSRQDIQLVQNLIERCLQLYMSEKEVVKTLLDQAKIEPGFTELVWQKLEEENQEFFKAYYLKLLVKEQILRFNQLLERQVDLMSQMSPAGISTVAMPQIPPMHQNSSCYAPERKGSAMKPENIHQPIDGLPNTFTNGGSSLHPCMQAPFDISSHATRIVAPVNMLLTKSTNVGMMQGMDGGMVKSQARYVGNSSFIFGADGNIRGTRPSVGDASVSSFDGVESNSQPLNETILDADTSSFGFLGQIPRNFSLSDLTADFSNSSDILESYSGSPYLAADTDNFLDPLGRGENQGDIRRLDALSQGLSYEDFGSD